ncbi:MAG: divalent metal cation transporter [Lewinella sp.]|nr:divalent metal cation transporter [Lewinella sp.]
MSSRIRSVLFWSILAAAFIGPGTVTTAAKSGSAYGLGLLWALVFSVLATMVLQEAAARLTLGASANLGSILGQRSGRGGRRVAYLLFGAIVLGCGAYQGGNLLGALAGLKLFGEVGRWWLVLLGALAALLLWSGNYRLITRVLAFVVAGMGITFVWAAFGAEPAAGDWLQGLQPRLDEGSALLAISLIGTTIVPYNLFLASGLSRGQTLSEMRWGLLIAVFGGGLITLAILLTGTQITGEFSFPALAAALSERLDGAGPYLLGIGLFAAGLSSAITAPLAAAVTGNSLFGEDIERWSPRGLYFRLTWGGVLLAGLLFSLTDVRPIPAIIAAQAVNGVILPLVAVFLLLAINERSVVQPGFTNPGWLNALGLAIVAVTVFLGLHNIWLALGKIWPALSPEADLPVSALLAAAVALVLGWRLRGQPT